MTSRSSIRHWLRRQLGVVLQENFLFNQTVHENIAMARPEMPRSAVIRVAGSRAPTNSSRNCRRATTL